MISNLSHKQKGGKLMADYIEMYKLWEDNDLAQVNVVCSSASVTASNKIYFCDSLIDELICEIKKFISGKINEAYWESGIKGDQSVACLSLHFLHKDRLGHILIEVYLEIDDGGTYSSHNCCFYINTEIGLLTTFCEKLPRLKLKNEGKVFLNESI